MKEENILKLNTLSRKSKYKKSLLILEILMILVAFLFFYPIIYVLINAFKSSSEIVLNPAGIPSKITFDNFIKVALTKGVGDVTFFTALFNTVLITVFSVLGIVLMSSLAAYKLVRTKTNFSSFIFVLFAFFLVIPFQVIMVPLVVLATDLQFKDWWGIVLMYIGLGVPGAILIYHGFIKGIPLSFEESAAIDGAGSWTIFFKIIFPLLTPITVTIGILNVIWTWNDFLLPYIILRKGTLILFQFNFFGQFTQDFGALSASLVMTAFPIVVLYLWLQKYIIKGITAGGEKG